MTRFFQYLDSIARINKLGNGGKVQWHFYSGMLFSSWDKWWADFGERASAHEGIDITYFKHQSGSINCLNSGTMVPALGNGRIINICSDFLGQTLVVEHNQTASSEYRLIYTYAHILPDKHLKCDDIIPKDHVIGQICAPQKTSQPPPHLHFSSFLIPFTIPCSKLDWNLFSKADEIIKINPLFI